jgi:hypothetical protein
VEINFDKTSDGGDHADAWSCASIEKRGAEFEAVGSAALGGEGGLRRIYADLEGNAVAHGRYSSEFLDFPIIAGFGD